MQKIYRGARVGILIALFALLASLVPAASAQATPRELNHANIAAKDDNIDTWMPNKEFQKLVLANLQRQWDEDHRGQACPYQQVSDITRASMKTLTSISNLVYVPSRGENVLYSMLSANPGVGEYSIKGLEEATNITYLNFSLELNSHPIVGYQSNYFVADLVDISPIAPLTKLTKLYIQGSRVSNITPILSILNGSTIEKVSLSHNAIGDFSGITNPRFQTAYENGQGYIFQIANQVIQADPVYVDPATNTASISFTDAIKLPFGKSLVHDFPYSPADLPSWCEQDGQAVRSMTLNQLYDPSVPTVTQAFYWGTGSSDFTRDDTTGTFTFRNILPQSTPGPDHVIVTNAGHTTTRSVPSVKTDYKYYLTMQLNKSSTWPPQAYFTVIVPYINTPLIVPAAKIVVSFVDETGNPIPGVSDEELPSANVGDPYTSTHKTIAGWTYVGLDPASAPESGTYTNTEQKILYRYRRTSTPTTTPATTTPSTTVTAPTAPSTTGVAPTAPATTDNVHGPGTDNMPGTSQAPMPSDPSGDEDDTDWAKNLPETGDGSPIRILVSVSLLFLSIGAIARIVHTRSDS